jgi:hypothetical protein
VSAKIKTRPPIKLIFADWLNEPQNLITQYSNYNNFSKKDILIKESYICIFIMSW